MTSHTHGTDNPAAHYPLTARCGAIVTDDGPGTCVGPTWTRARVLDPRLGMLPPCPVCFPEPAPAPGLRRLAEAATPGPWSRCGDDRGGCGCRLVFAEHAAVAQACSCTDADSMGEGYTEKQAKATAAYIAAANPQVVIGLLDTIDRLTARVAEMEAANAAATERAAIVAWLRNGGNADYPYMRAADAIERGAHTPTDRSES